MPLVDYQLAQVLTLADGRAVEWESVGEGPPLIWVEGGPGFWAHLARPDVGLVPDLFRGHIPQYEQPAAFRTALVDWLGAT